MFQSRQAFILQTVATGLKMGTVKEVAAPCCASASDQGGRLLTYSLAASKNR